MAEDQVSSTEVTNEEGGEVVTLQEILETEQELLDNATAVLGAGDDKNCTYSEGYMKRQALYACLTCVPDSRADVLKRAGVCLACCYHCHDGHELVELYTKRAFRCDCGNTKFSKPCSLISTKEEVNALNQYNQNFSGTYCTCSRPYPDPEDSVSDEMIQCIVCEDWFHVRHLGVETPPQNSYSEMTCEGCIQKHQFLLHYDGLCVTKITAIPDKIVDVVSSIDETLVAANESQQTNVVNVDTFVAPIQDEAPENETNKEDPAIESNQLLRENGINTSEGLTQEAMDAAEVSSVSSKVSEPNEAIPMDAEPIEAPAESIGTPSIISEISTTGATVGDSPDNSINTSFLSELDTSALNICRKPKEKSDVVSTKFWGDSNWREQLCVCSECLKVYEDEKVSFLIDLQDTVQTYEERGKVKALETARRQEENELKYLNSLDRVPLLEAIAGFKDLKENLGEYLKKFAENKKVVREEDIKEFFSAFRSKKKPKHDGQFYCR